MGRFYQTRACTRTWIGAALGIFLLCVKGADLHGQTIVEHQTRHSNFDMRHVRLELQFDGAQQKAIGKATLTLVLRENTQTVAFDAGLLTIFSVRLAHGTTLSFSYDGGDQDNGLAVKLDRAYRVGERVVLEIAYQTNWVNQTDPDNLWGSYGKGLRFFRPTTTEPRKRTQIWSMGEPNANRYWFPSYDAPNDLRTFELLATVDTPLFVVSNGKLSNTTNRSDGKRTFHWISDQPHANHQSAVVIGTFKDHIQYNGRTALHSYGYPDEYEAVKATTVRLPDMFRYFSQKIGLAYPFPNYAQVTIQEFPWGGGHHASFSAVSENMIDDYGTHADFFYLWDGVEAQDLAAQWFCNALPPRDWEHAWLCKSMAIYFDCLYSEYKNGLDEMLLWNRQFQLNTYLADWNNGIRRPVVTRFYDKASTMTRDNYASLRGALVLHMLRKHLGEEKWWKAVRLYARSNAHQTVTTDDLLRAVETAAGEPMGWFFEQWLYKMGHPIFEAQYTYDPKAQLLTLRLKQTQAAEKDSVYAHAGYFRGKMTVEIDQRLETVWIKPQQENVFQFKCPSVPKLVQVDYQNTWIKELKWEKTTEDWQHQFEYDRDVTGRRSAMTALTNIARNDSTSQLVRDRIYASFRKVIQGNAYWRIRYSALLSLQSLLVADPTQPVRLDNPTTDMLLSIIQNEKSWNRAVALSFLGATQSPQYTDLYLQYLKDESDRVVNAAAIALGSSQSPQAYETLVRLKNKPSWKNQSLISALNGLKMLQDPRGGAFALEALADRQGIHWTLATSTWDYRLAAAETLAALGQGNDGYPMIFQRLTEAHREGDINDIFSNILLIIALKASQGAEAFAWLKGQYMNNPTTLAQVEKLEALWKETQVRP